MVLVIDGEIQRVTVLHDEVNLRVLLLRLLGQDLEHNLDCLIWLDYEMDSLFSLLRAQDTHHIVL